MKRKKDYSWTKCKPATSFTLVDYAIGSGLQHCWCSPSMKHCDEPGVMAAVRRPHFREVAEMFTWSINSSVDVPWPLGRTEYRPAIDKANSLVPHSAPSKAPLKAHHREWVAPHTLDAQDHTFPALMLVTGLWFGHALNFYFEVVDSLMTSFRQEEVCQS